MKRREFFSSSIAVLFSVSCASRNPGLSAQTGLPQVSKTKNNNDKGPKPKGYPGEHWDIQDIGTRDITGGPNFYSIEKEIALGKQFADEIEQHAKIVDDPVVAEYVNRIGQNLVRNSDTKVPFHIKVIEDPEINAFALPGGFFFVNSGLIMVAREEAELAGVMAHEIAHVAARHGTRQATKAQIINWATVPLIFLGGWAGYGIRQAAGFAIPMAFLKFSRSAEDEADELGAQYMYLAGYDPTAFPSFFELLKSMEKRRQGKISKIFSSHPSHEFRMALIQKMLSVEEVFEAKREYVTNTSEFINAQRKLGELLRVNGKKEKDPNKPTLRRKTGDEGVIKPEDQDKEKENEDEPTVIKRNPKSEE